MAETNVKFLKENHLYEAHKHFMRMAEGYGYTQAIEEADDDEQGQDNNGPDGAPDQSQNDKAPMNGEMPIGGDSNTPMDDTQNGGMDMQNGGMDMPQGGEDTDPILGQQNDTLPMNDPTSSEPPSNEEGQDEEVIDVDDVVKAQEKTNDKVNSVGRDLGTVDRRIEKLLSALEDMQGVIDKNNAEIADLKREFEKRNPTQTEKLNLRSLDSYPFNVRPNDYWRQKGFDSNYSAYGDNEEPTTKEYTITNDDVRNISNNIANTFDIPEEDIQDFNKIFNM